METVITTASALRIRSRPSIDPTTDTGKRLIHGQYATAYGASFDKKWWYIEAPAGEGWASAGYLQRTPSPIIPSPLWPPIPNGLLEIRETFGPHCGSGTGGVVELPLSLALSWDPGIRVNSFRCHKLVTEPFQKFFDEIARRDLWSHLNNEWGGCYNCRMKQGTTTKWSTHSWGIAFDIAVSRNQFGRVPTLDSRVVRIGEDLGLTWGGRWNKPDGMHFQYAKGY